MIPLKPYGFTKRAKIDKDNTIDRFLTFIKFLRIRFSNKNNPRING